MKNFAVIGAGGYVAPRHLRAIRSTGNRTCAALDPNDSVGILDEFGHDIAFFTDERAFAAYLSASRVHIVSVCSPNHLHEHHCRLAMTSGADVICEKPLVVDPTRLEELLAFEEETQRRIWTVLQLRTHERLVDLQRSVRGAPGPYEVELTYITPRGQWYDASWKGSTALSGGIATNIGVHLFDLLLWFFGAAIDVRVHLREERRMAGVLLLERARVRWFLSVEPGDLPSSTRCPVRSIRIDGSELDFTDGFGDLHTRVYERTLAGAGFPVALGGPSIRLAHEVRRAAITPPRGEGHRLLRSLNSFH